jgi:hypothetical protein
MANFGLFIALCAVLLAVDGSAQPAPAVEAPAAPPCKFTLERQAAHAAEDDDEIWLLTCHRPATAVQRRPVTAPEAAAPAL